MSKRTYLEKRIADLQAELYALVENEDKWGSNSDYAEEAVLMWTQTYENGKEYTFVAIKAAGHWYTSGIFQHVKITFETLVERHLSRANQVWIAKQWEEM